MKSQVFIATLLLTVTCVGTTSGQWAGPNVPDSLSFQGLLSKSNGTLVDSTMDITFKMYKGATEVWSQTKTDVVVSNGVFDVILGGDGGVFRSIPFDAPIDVGITIGGSELTPRTPLTPAAYALGLRGLYAVRGSGLAGDDAMNLIGGAANNFVDADVTGATISGGGGWLGLPPDGVPDSVTGSWGTVGGGRGNRAEAAATVGGGANNKATGPVSAIGGGTSNAATAFEAVVAGGRNNEASGDQSTIGGGQDNVASDHWATVGGGQDNAAIDLWTTVGGGQNNSANGDHATVGGGSNNSAVRSGSTIGGGSQNQTNGLVATVAGGNTNFAAGFESAVGGGGRNIASTQATVGGGDTNIAGGTGSTVPGGALNRAMGEYSLAAGYYAVADHNGTFVWNDRSSPGGADSLLSTGENQFLIRAAGGVGIGTDAPANAFHVAKSISAAASVGNHVAVIDNTSTGSSADVLALRVGRSTNPEATNAFITFKYNGNTSAGFIRGDGTGGIELVSQGADYAELLPHVHPEESIQSGDVVGVFAGSISKLTAGAEQVMVVSTSPIVLGNHDMESDIDPPGSSPVAFIGQAPVKVRGPAQAGDFLIPSGFNDGAAVAVDPADISVRQLSNVVGTAWESKSGSGVGLVNAAIGIDQISASVQVIKRLRERQAALQSAVQQLADRLDKLEGLASN